MHGWVLLRFTRRGLDPHAVGAICFFLSTYLNDVGLYGGAWLGWLHALGDPVGEFECQPARARIPGQRRPPTDILNIAYPVGIWT